MKRVKPLVLSISAIAASAGILQAADRTDLHGTDNKWINFNLMYAVDEKPENPASGSQHDYLEMEFGGRSGILDIYGYIDIFNLANQTSSEGDKNPDEGKSKMFMKFAPRVSIDALTGKDLSFGPVQETYFSALYNWDGLINEEDGTGVNSTFWGVGADVIVPWLNKIGVNLYGFYDLNTKEWNGYQISVNWFKPFHEFENKSFFCFQGYIDYQFGADSDSSAFVPTTSDGGTGFFGLYWHTERYALGYGLKAFNDVYLIEDGAGDLALDSTGVAHYLSATYKF